MAARHRAARLQPAEQGTLRPRIHRRRQPPASAGHDPPRAARLAGAFRRRADRTLRRRVPALARAGASPRADRQRKVRRLRPRSRAAACKTPASAFPATTAGQSSTPKSATPRCSSSRICSSSARRDRDARTRFGPRSVGRRSWLDATRCRDRQAPRRNRRQNRSPSRSANPSQSPTALPKTNTDDYRLVATRWRSAVYWLIEGIGAPRLLDRAKITTYS